MSKKFYRSLERISPTPMPCKRTAIYPMVAPRSGPPFNKSNTYITIPVAVIIMPILIIIEISIIDPPFVREFFTDNLISFANWF